MLLVLLLVLMQSQSGFTSQLVCVCVCWCWPVPQDFQRILDEVPLTPYDSMCRNERVEELWTDFGRHCSPIAKSIIESIADIDKLRVGDVG